MTGFLDTNVPSKLTRPQSEPQVELWLDNAGDELLFFSVVPLGEIFKGLTICLKASAAGNYCNAVMRTTGMPATPMFHRSSPLCRSSSA
jgi:hypothetical protein